MTVRIRANAPRHQAVALAEGLPLEASYGQRVRVWDVLDGSWRDPFRRWTVSWGGRWSPGGELLAGYVYQAGGPPRLALWDRGDDEVRVLPPVAAPFFTFSRPQWALNGTAVVCLVASRQRSGPGDDRDAGGSVRVLTSPDRALDQQEALEHADVALVDVATAHVRTLARDWTVRGCRVAPDGTRIACLRVERFPSAGHTAFYALEVIDLRDGTVTTPAHDIPEQYGLRWSWSPDGRHIAYVANASHRPDSYWVVAVDGATAPRRLEDPSRPRRRRGAGDQSGAFEAPRWLSPQVVVCQHGDGYLCWDLADPTPRPRSITTPGPGIWLQDFDHGGLVTTSHGRWLSLVDNPDGSCAVQLVDQTDGSTDLIGGYPGHASTHPLQVAGASDRLPGVVLVEPPGGTWEIWLADASGARRLAELNANARAPHTSSRITWEHTGERLQAALFVPTSRPPSAGYPVVVSVYGGARRAQLAGRFDPEDGLIHTSLLTRRGIAVLYPDLPMTDTDPMGQFGPLLAGVLERLQDEPVDLGRLSVIGHSYGSYTALSLLVTLPETFRSAVLTAPIVNPLASYGALTAAGTAFDGYWESGGGRLGGPPWERPHAYLDNTPYLRLDQVTARVLIASGTAGLPGETAQAEQLFSGLRRLDRVAELRVYDREGHTPTTWSPDAYRDFAERAADWLCDEAADADNPTAGTP